MRILILILFLALCVYAVDVIVSVNDYQINGDRVIVDYKIVQGNKLDCRLIDVPLNSYDAIRTDTVWTDSIHYYLVDVTILDESKIIEDLTEYFSWHGWDHYPTAAEL